MPLKGFECPLNGVHRTLDDCVKCPSPCVELPILFALLAKNRVVAEGRFSVTEVLKPPRALAMERKYDFWVSPYSLVAATFGTTWHLMVERQREAMAAYGRLDKDYTFEEANHFEVVVDVDGKPIVVHGTPDQYHHPSHTLTDYKTVKYYFTWEKLSKGDWTSNEYAKQVNMYRRYKFPYCKRMQLVALVKDWNRRLSAEKLVPPIDKLIVPFIANEDVDEFVLKSLRDHLIAEADIDKARDCTASERWNHKGVDIRCDEFCPCHIHCPQWKEKNLK